MTVKPINAAAAYFADVHEEYCSECEAATNQRPARQEAANGRQEDTNGQAESDQAMVIVIDLESDSEEERPPDGAASCDDVTGTSFCSPRHELKILRPEEINHVYRTPEVAYHLPVPEETHPSPQPEVGYTSPQPRALHPRPEVVSPLEGTRSLMLPEVDDPPEAKYEVLKRHLASVPLVLQLTEPPMEEPEADYRQRKRRLAAGGGVRATEFSSYSPEEEKLIRNTGDDDENNNSTCDRVSHEHQTPEQLPGDRNVNPTFSPVDLALRYRVIIFLWILLGESRLRSVGYPTEPMHSILWRVVVTCCSLPRASAWPLPEHHDCGNDMHCFRQHVHRFLETCAPTKELWKEFEWTGLSVDGVVEKIYRQELLPTLVDCKYMIPEPIHVAMCKLAQLDKMAVTVRRHIGPRWRRVQTRGHGVKYVPVSRDQLAGRKMATDVNRLERVLLWRFVLHLLDDPRHLARLHWLDREKGTFRIRNTDWLVRIWARRTGNPRMTYTKLAATLRCVRISSGGDDYCLLYPPTWAAKRKTCSRNSITQDKLSELNKPETSRSNENCIS